MDAQRRTSNEIAQAIGRTPGAVRMKLHRLRAETNRTAGRQK